MDTLELSGNNLINLNKNVFAETMPRLRKLLLNRNNLKILASDTFVGLPSLDYLSLGHNSHIKLNTQMFAPLKRLKKLHLGNNYIEEIPADVLESFNDLTELLLDHNKLTFLPEVNATFPFLKKIAIEGNPWQCPCLDFLVGFFEERKIQYQRNNGYFDGRKPLCVVTPVKFCVRNLKVVQDYGVSEIYEKMVGEPEDEEEIDE